MSPSSSRLYRLLLLCHPEAFRGECGAEMLRTFEDRMRRGGSIRLLVNECLDVVATGLRSRFAEERVRPRVRKGTRMELFVRDVRHAARSLLRSPGFTVVAFVSLALGIGANSAIFSLVNAALLKPLPVERPATRGDESFPLNLSYPNYRDMSELDLFEDLVGFQGANVSLETAGGDPALVWGELVTENYFTGLGVDPAIGRTFLPEDVDRSVAVLSHDFWRRRFEGKDTVLGRRVRINRHEFEVVGVAREGFTGAKFLGFTPDVYVPVTMHEVIWQGSEGRLDRRQGAWLNVRLRTKPGTALTELQAALETVARRLESDHPDVNRGLRLHAMPAPRKTEPVVEVELGGVLPVVSTVLLTVVGIVLLIACANVASLMMARVLGRERELAVRLSLGATSARIVRELVVESLLVVAVAGLFGVWLGQMLLDAALTGRRFWPDERAIGKRFESADGSLREVVGVARDGKYFHSGRRAPVVFLRPASAELPLAHDRRRENGRSANEPRGWPPG